MPKLEIPNIIQKDLKIIFVGINPGLRSAATGHHFAGHSNRFWRLLADSGLTPECLTAEQDRRLLEFEYGITNIVSRSSASAAELTRKDYQTGAAVLIDLLQEQRPLIAAYLGKDIYPYLAKRRNISWGIQQPSVIESIIDYVLPNPSGLNRMPYREQLFWYLELKGLI